MSTIQSTIKLNDQMSAKLQTIQRTVGATEAAFNQFNIQINNTANDIKNINNAAASAGGGLDSLASKVKGVIAALGGLAVVKQAINISDDLTSMTARLNMVDQAFNGTNANIDAFTQKIYAAANASRGSFDSMASLVARLGNNAADAFSSTDELIQFATNTQRLMTIAGASTQEASNAMLQLSQALASGVLRGDELNSIFEQAPNLIQTIADYMDVPIGSIRTMASEGQITADIVKAALLSATDEINEKFEQMPMTFGQAATQIQNYALQAFTPVLNSLNDALNSSTGQAAMQNLMNGISTAASVASGAINVLGNALQFVYNNANTLLPVFGTLIGLITAYNIVQGITAGITAAVGFAHSVAAAAEMLHSGATFAATVAQNGFNAALLACPLTWIVLAIVAVIAVVLMFAGSIADAGGVAESTFAVICGWISVVIAWFQNLWQNILILCSNIPIAFNNACAGAEQAFWNLLATAMSVISQIASALSALPFVEFDASGLSAAADGFAAKAQAAGSKKQSYNSLQSFNATAAYNKGATWGNNKLSGLKSSASKLTGSGSSGTGISAPVLNTIAGNTGSSAGSGGKTAGNTGKTAGNTSAIKNKLDDTEEDLKYLCDIAERDAINRFTTASIAIDMVNNNSISSGMDLDTIVDGLTSRLQTSMAMVAEGA